METPNENQTSPAMPGCAPTAGSDLIEVRMRGGTVIRIPAGRGDGMPYDLLLEALKVCQHWDDDEEEWRDGDPFVYLEVIHGQNGLALARAGAGISTEATDTQDENKH